MRFHASVFIIAQAFSLANAQLVDPYPMSNCNGGIAGFELQCPGANGCCSSGAVCCAGGCCPLTANCINVGTSDEGCCPFGDTTNCGFGVTTYAAPACTDVSGFKPQKQCVGASGSWTCPPEDGCDLMNGGCIPYPAVSCTYDDGDSPQTTSPADSITTYTSSSEYTDSGTYFTETFSDSSKTVSDSPQTTSPAGSITTYSSSSEDTDSGTHFTGTFSDSTEAFSDSPQTTSPVDSVTTYTSSSEYTDSGTYFTQTFSDSRKTFSDSSSTHSSSTESQPTSSDAAETSPAPDAANHMQTSRLLTTVVGASVILSFCL